MSGNVDSAISKSGMVENVGVAIEVSFVVALRAQVPCIYADFEVFPVAIFLDFWNVPNMV